MTDRERLQEQVRAAEERAGEYGESACLWMRPKLCAVGGNTAWYDAKIAAHHTLTALALREAIALEDWRESVRPFEGE